MRVTVGLIGAYPVVLFGGLNEEIHFKPSVQNLVYKKCPMKVNSCYLMVISVGMETTESIQERFGRKLEDIGEEDSALSFSWHLSPLLSLLGVSAT